MVNKIADKFPSKLTPEIVKSFRNTNTAGNGFMKSNHVLAPKADNTVHVDIYKHDNVDFVQALKAKYLSNSIAGTSSKVNSMPNRKSGVLSRARIDEIVAGYPEGTFKAVDKVNENGVRIIYEGKSFDIDEFGGAHLKAGVLLRQDL